MNRREFLLGTIATPIAAKVSAVSAALRPIATDPYGLSPMQSVLPDMRTAQQIIEHMMRQVYKTMEYKRAEYDLMAYGQSMFDVAKAVAEIALLDNPSEPCDASIAGRDQIG